MNKIRFSCSHCGGKLVVDGRYASKPVRCPRCNQVSTIPTTAASLVDGDLIVAEDISGKRTKTVFCVQLAGAFMYPFKGSGFLLVIIATVVRIALQLLAGILPMVWLIGAFFSCYLVAYYVSIVASSATGEEELPDWPDFSSFWNDVFRPVLFST